MFSSTLLKNHWIDCVSPTSETKPAPFASSRNSSCHCEKEQFYKCLKRRTIPLSIVKFVLTTCTLSSKKKTKTPGKVVGSKYSVVQLSVTVVGLQIKAEPWGWCSRPVILSALWLPISDRIQLQLLHTSSKERAWILINLIWTILCTLHTYSTETHC